MWITKGFQSDHRELIENYSNKNQRVQTKKLLKA